VSCAGGSGWRGATSTPSSATEDVSVPTVSDVCSTLDAIAPPHLAFEGDPIGLLVGDPDASVERVVVALDVTALVVEAAKARDATLIIAHHPLIYHPLKAVRADEPHPGAVVLACAQ